MAWTCNACTELHPEFHLQCSCGYTRQRTDIATAASIAHTITETTVHAAVVRNAIAAAFAATNRGHNGYDDDYEDEDDDGDDDDDDGDDDDDDDDDELLPPAPAPEEPAAEQAGDVDDDVDDDDDDEDEEKEALVKIPAHFFDTKSGRVLADTQGDIAVINNAYDSRARLVNENTVGGTSPVGVGVRMEHLSDYHCDPVTREPPSQGVEFLILDANGQPNRQVFELSQLIEYFRVHISTAEGQWRTKVKHPNQNIWCDHEEFLDYIKPVSEEVQTYLTNCRIRSGLNAVDHPLSLNQLNFIDRCRQGHRREMNRRVRPRRDDARGRRTHGH